jgi:acetyltransferase-like isoleucine patch superfamily enzyme
LLPGIKIGNNVVIGAGSIVSKNIPSNSVSVGNPCKVIKENAAYEEDIYNVDFNKKPKNKFD